MSIPRLEDFFTTEDNPVAFEGTGYSPEGDGYLHTHAFYEIVYMVSGKTTHTVIDKDGVSTTSDFHEGSLILLRPTDAHKFHKPTSPYFHRDIVIPIGVFGEICDFLSPDLLCDIESSRIPLQITLSPDKVSLFEKKIKLISQILPSIQHQKLALIKSIVVTLLECLLASDTESYFDNFPSWFRSLLAKFDDPEYLKLGLNKITDECNYDKKYLCYVFKKYTGTTMTEYLNDARLDTATTLLRNTTKTVSDIALDLGFSSVAYFNTIFKRRYGYTPKEIRKNKSL